MSLGPVMLDLVGIAITPEEREMLCHPQTGGVILFSRNYESPEQITKLVKEIHALRSPQLLVAVDHEGGRVQRFREGFTQIPAAGRVGDIYATDKFLAQQLAQDCGWLMAAECRAVGIDMSFAPVLDIDIGLSGVIGDRAYNASPVIIAELANAYMKGMQQAGMAATGKHFPGHGSVKEDSHIAQPIDNRPLNAIMAEDMRPFEHMIAHGLAAMMPAHVIYPAVDDKPAGYSSIWLQQILREKLNFQGVIFSDDLSMNAAGVSTEFSEKAEKALSAGCDMVLVCNHVEAAQQVLMSLEGYSNAASQTRLMTMQGREALTRQALMSSQRWKMVVEKLVRLNDDSE
ncbi:beta-N-acetylglucosaminidase [hydrothermal vent metagenome]|uniref:beta-N-acetylhexosaminidase n=1 Tax=hydrothermal vent metagenome TaxID=652676 RepID=A0A3B0XNB4_9ZZZZ